MGAQQLFPFFKGRFLRIFSFRISGGLMGHAARPSETLRHFQNQDHLHAPVRRIVKEVLAGIRVHVIDTSGAESVEPVVAVLL